MGSIITKKAISLENIIPDPIYYLNRIAARYRYVDGKRTDEYAGYVYTATSTDSFEQINVLIEQKKPLLLPEKLEELQESGEKMFVEFIGAVVKPYYSSKTGAIEDSIKANDVKLMEI